jgi:hypothetical protein
MKKTIIFIAVVTLIPSLESYAMKTGNNAILPSCINTVLLNVVNHLIDEGSLFTLDVNRKGYNAFFISYSINIEDIDCEELVASITHAFAKEERQEPGTYTHWTFLPCTSIIAWFLDYGTMVYNVACTKPDIKIVNYTAHMHLTYTIPLSFTATEELHLIVSPYNIEQQIDYIRAAGIEVVYHISPNALACFHG